MGCLFIQAEAKAKKNKLFRFDFIMSYAIDVILRPQAEESSAARLTNSVSLAKK
jgi:hypothetical protein